MQISKLTKKIVLTGQTPSQKNSKNVGVNPKTGRVFVASNKIVKDWQKTALVEATLWQQRNLPEPCEEKLFATYMFFVKDMRRRDLDNMIASCNDVLVKAGILEDDSWQWLGLSGADAVVDSTNPRVEIYLDI